MHLSDKAFYKLSSTSYRWVSRSSAHNLLTAFCQISGKSFFGVLPPTALFQKMDLSAQVLFTKNRVANLL